MSPRPRKASDDQIFGAVFRVMQRVKPDELTLAAVGKEAGVTAGALVQRFGSKREMMRALNAAFAASTGDFLGGLRAAHDSPLATLRAFAEGYAGMAGTSERLAHHLAYLQMDLSDPEMCAQVTRHTRATRATLRKWVREAVAAGELRDDTDPAMLARIVHTAVTGSMMSYAFFEEGTPANWLRKDLDLVIRPYLPHRPR